MSGVLVVAEARRGELREVSFELLGAAATLSGPVRVLLVGDAPADALNVPGVEEVLTVASPREHFEPHLQAEAVKQAIARLQPAVVLAPHSLDGLSYAAAVAAELDLGFASDVIAIEDGPVVTRGAYAHRLVARLEFPGKATTVLTVRPGAYEAVAPGGGSARVTPADFAPDESLAAVEHLGYVEPEIAGEDITAANLVLALGRGVPDADTFAELEGVAEAINATVAASRPLVDAGFVSATRQVGQSGRTVKPKVYLALGISGAVQHLAGVRAGTVIAVNTDPAAPIFQAADYGAVADLREVARELPQHFR